MNVLGVEIHLVPASERQRWIRRAVAIGALNALVLGGGIAYANWTTSGSGTAAATAGTALGVTGPALTVSTVTSGSLVPNGSTAVVVSVTNPNAFQVVVSAISVPNATAPTTVLGSGCTTTNAKVSIPSTVSAFSLGTGVIAGGATATFTSTASTVVVMAIDSDNACQGARFGFPATVTAAAG